MNSLHLSKRLQTLASMIDDNITVYDVGCDHAYLDIYLTLYKNNECIAIDSKDAVIKIAKDNVNKYKLNIPVVLNDGLRNINVKKHSLVVIAGMGTRTILKILQEKPTCNLLIQSNDDLPLLRKTLSDWGYKIIDEKVEYENNYYYVFIKFTIGNSNYTKKELLLGPILMNTSNNLTYIDYLHNLNKKYHKMLSNVPKEFLSDKSELLESIEIIEKYLNI